MIDINKKYRTRDGREVRIYAVDGDEPRPVHGAHKSQTGWVFSCWEEDGVHLLSTGNYDLIEVKPRIKREVWLNIYEREHAARSRLACVRVEIDCEEGEGL